MVRVEVNTKENSMDSIGVGQEWQDVTSSRKEGVIYENATDRPIQVNISAFGTYPNTGTVRLMVGPTSPPMVAAVRHVIDNSNSIQVTLLSAIIPPRHFYRLSDEVASVFIRHWAELC